MATHPELQQTLGPLFALKMTVLVVTVLGCVAVHRFFCKAMCPLGAIYGLMNGVSFYRLTVDEKKYIRCGRCAQVCGMDVDPVRTPASPECIRCGDCAAACPTGAIRVGFGFFRKKAEGGCLGRCEHCSGCKQA